MVNGHIGVSRVRRLLGDTFSFDSFTYINRSSSLRMFVAGGARRSRIRSFLVRGANLRLHYFAVRRVGRVPGGASNGARCPRLGTLTRGRK